MTERVTLRQRAAIALRAQEQKEFGDLIEQQRERGVAAGQWLEQALRGLGIRAYPPIITGGTVQSVEARTVVDGLTLVSTYQGDFYALETCRACGETEIYKRYTPHYAHAHGDPERIQANLAALAPTLKEQVLTCFSCQQRQNNREMGRDAATPEPTPAERLAEAIRLLVREEVGRVQA